MTLATAYAWRRQFAAARKVADAGARHYHEDMLPVRMTILRLEIQLNRGSSKTPIPPQQLEKMRVLRQQCKATGKKPLIEDCGVAETGIAPEEQYKNCGGLISAVAGLSPFGTKRCGPAGSQPKAATPVAGITPTPAAPTGGFSLPGLIANTIGKTIQ